MNGRARVKLLTTRRGEVAERLKLSRFAGVSESESPQAKSRAHVARELQRGEYDSFVLSIMILFGEVAERLKAAVC